MMKKETLILFVFLICCLSSYGQSPSFSQFFQKNPYVNPAYTGIMGGQEIHTIVHHREQWMNIPIKYTTSLLSSDWRICQKNLGIGVIALQNTEGEGLLKTNEISIPLASHINISKRSSISSAIQLTAITRSINWDNLIFSDQLHPVLGQIYNSSVVRPKENYNQLTISSGFIWTLKGNLFKGGYNQASRHDHFSLGMALHNISGFDDSFYGSSLGSLNPTKLTVHASTLIKNNIYGNIKNRNISFFDYINLYAIHENQGVFDDAPSIFQTTSLGFGISMRKVIMFGLTYRNAVRQTEDFGDAENLNRIMKESLIYNFVLNFNPRNVPYQMYITYSYDMNISDLSNLYTGPTHEISLNMYFGKVRCRPKRRKSKAHWWDNLRGMGRNKSVFNRELCQPFSKISEWDGY